MNGLQKTPRKKTRQYQQIDNMLERFKDSFFTQLDDPSVVLFVFCTQRMIKEEWEAQQKKEQEEKEQKQKEKRDREVKPSPGG